MYTLMLSGGDILYDPRMKNYGLGNPSIDREANKLSTLSFTIYPNHPQYSYLYLKSSRIEVYEDGDLLMVMRPIQRKRLFLGGIEYRCEELAGVMNDILLRPVAYGDGYTYVNIVNWILANLAAYDFEGLDTDIVLGTISQTFDEEIDADSKFVISDYKGAWDTLVSSTSGTYGGYIVPRYAIVSGRYKVYIDWLNDADIPTNTQGVTFGVNMQELLITTDMDDFFTRLIPLGKDVSNDSAEKSAGGPSQVPLTIKDATNKPSYLADSDCIYDPDEVALYGAIDYTKRWDDISSANDLYDKGQEYFDEHHLEYASDVTIKAIDLKDAGYNVSRLRWMTKIPVDSSIHGIYGSYIVKRHHIALGAPDASTYQLGTTKPSLTDLTAANRSRQENENLWLTSRVFALENPEP